MVLAFQFFVVLISFLVYRSNAAVTLNAWQNQLQNKDRLPTNYVNIPGTHDTLTNNMNGYAKCQDQDIVALLNAGMRVFDLRLRKENGVLVGCHGSTVDATNSFKSIQHKVANWLHGHATEWVIFKIKEEKTTSEKVLGKWGATTFKLDVANVIALNKSFYYQSNTNTIPMCTAAAQKIIYSGPDLDLSQGGPLQGSKVISVKIKSKQKTDKAKFYSVRWGNRGDRLTKIKRSIDVACRKHSRTMIRYHHKAYHMQQCNTNSAGTATHITGNGGHPLQWARWINPNVTRYLNTKKQGGCAFVGIVTFDFATAADVEQVIRMNTITEANVVPYNDLDDNEFPDENDADYDFEEKQPKKTEPGNRDFNVFLIGGVIMLAMLFCTCFIGSICGFGVAYCFMYYGGYGQKKTMDGYNKHEYETETEENNQKAIPIENGNGNGNGNVEYKKVQQ